MELNFFKDHLFDLLNESNLLDVQEILYDDKTSPFKITIYDGTVFVLTCSLADKTNLQQNKSALNDKRKILSMEEIRFLVK